MYETALTFHNFLRLAVVLVAAWVVLRAFRGWFGKKPWSIMDRTSVLVLTILVDVQLLIGLLLHILWSPVTKSAWANAGEAMKEPSIRWFFVEHPVMMIVAVALVHIGKATGKGAPTDKARHRKVALFVGIALVLFLVGTPWPWQEVARPWLRMPG
jgi:hypothetical protein